MFLWMIPCIWDDYDLQTPISLKSDMEISICVVIPFILNDVSFQNFGQNISMAIN